MYIARDRLNPAIWRGRRDDGQISQSRSFTENKITFHRHVRRENIVQNGLDWLLAVNLSVQCTRYRYFVVLDSGKTEQIYIGSRQGFSTFFVFFFFFLSSTLSLS